MWCTTKNIMCKSLSQNGVWCVFYKPKTMFLILSITFDLETDLEIILSSNYEHYKLMTIQFHCHHATENNYHAISV